MNIDQDRQMLMVDDNVGNQFRQNAVQNVGNLVGQNAVQNQDKIAQKEEARIQLTQEEFDFMADAGAYEEIERDSDESAENDSNVISAVSSVEQSGETVEQHPANVEETQAANFVRDFQSLAKEADESLAKHKALELEIERLLRAIISQDIMAIVQNPSIVD
ncbi:hypothetical protein Tco_0158938 [Tanacetum coccineum]